VSTDEVKRDTGTSLAVWTATGMGVVTFVVGVVLLIKVFGWAYEVFQGIDASFGKVTVSAPVVASGHEAPSKPSAETSHRTSGQSVQACPGNRGLLETMAIIGMKLVGLLILGWIAAMLAARGAGMVGASRGPKNSG